VKRANPGRCLAGVECHGRAGRGSGAFRLDNLGHLECWGGLGRCRCWTRGRSAGLGRGSSCLLRSRSLGHRFLWRSRRSLARSCWCWLSPDLWHFGTFSFVYAGSPVACTGILSSSGATGIGAGIRNILLSPYVHVDIGGRTVLFRQRVVLRRGGSLLWRRQRCSRRRGNRAHRRHIWARG
jgi:hypothetical protein